MATYKLIQDIEAEDHILGPLSLRQFIYALVAVFCFYISFILFTKHVAFLTPIFILPGLFCAFFAFPFGKDQSTELWALAKLRFYFKPRVRIWNQSGVKELVTITVPKKIERVLSDGLSQNEVESRLKALANTIDSRGWAIKNVNVNAFAQPDPVAVMSSDRLLGMSSLPQEVSNVDVQASDDMLDATSNPIAQQFDSMINASEQAHRQQLVQQMNAPQGQPAAGPPPDYWFMQQQAAQPAPGQAMFQNTQIVQPGSQDTVLPAAAPADAADEAALDASLKAHQGSQHAPYDHLRTLQPLRNDPQSPTITPAVATAAPSAAQPDPAILSLANNNDLNVATIARQADKAMQVDGPSDDEVVIPLR